MRMFRVAALAIAVVCTGCTRAGDEPLATGAFASRSTTSSGIPSLPPSSTEPSVEPSPSPKPPLQLPVPARAPDGLVALTEGGDVQLIDVATATARTIASYPPVHAAEGGAPVSSFLTDVATVPGGWILLSSCCEPAIGYIGVVNRLGEEARPSFYGDDPEVDPSGRRLAMTSLQSLAILPASLERRYEGTISAGGLFGPHDVGWSPNGKRLIFSLYRRLGLVDVTAASLRTSQYLLPSEGTYWGSTAYPRRGLLAVEIEGRARYGDEGPSQILRVDFTLGRRRVVRSSTQTITDLATDRSGRSMLWVEGGTLHWLVGGSKASLPGDYVKASFVPG